MNELQDSCERELELCASSFEYFCEKYIKLNNPAKEEIPFSLFEYQKRYTKFISENRFCIAKKFRQSGLTTLTLAWLTWRFIFKQDEQNMVMSKSESECSHCSDVVCNFIDKLPDFLRPKLRVRQGHMLSHAENKNILFFHKPEAGRGRKLNYLFIDEAAFISNMDLHWRAIYPCVSMDGHCIVVSTTNGVDNWFYDTYTQSNVEGRDFKIFRCSHTEHAEFSNPDWIARAKTLMGEKAWRQEILQEFEGEESPAVETETETETMKQLELDFEPEVKKEVWSIEHNDPFENQPMLFDPLGTSKQNHGEQPEIYRFKTMTKEQQEAFIQKYMAKSKPVEPLCSMDTFDLKPESGLEDFLDAYDETFEVKKKMDIPVIKAIKSLDQMTQELEEKINENVSDDQLFMAGIEIERGKSKTAPSKAVLSKVQAKFANLKLKFKEERLYVNDAPTIIFEDDVRDLYNGTLAFESPESAIATVCDVIEKRLATIFCQVSQ